MWSLLKRSNWPAPHSELNDLTDNANIELSAGDGADDHERLRAGSDFGGERSVG